MPIPVGAHQVRGNPLRVQLSDGRQVSRASALTQGARDMGYKSHYEYRKNSEGDKKYFSAWAQTSQGRNAIANGKARGLSKSEVKLQLIAARNDRPHPGSGKGGGQAYQGFMVDYDMMDDGDDWVDY
jgi:hypothetical protein